MMMRLVRALSHTAAGIWLGGLVVLAIVAPTTFSVMRETGVDQPNAIAGQVMAKNFLRFDLVQLICGIVLLGGLLMLLAIGPRRMRDWLRIAAAGAAVLLMLYSTMVMTPQILNLQPLLAEPDADAAVRAAFEAFHSTAVRVSQALLLLLLLINLEMAFAPLQGTPHVGGTS